MTLQDEIKLLLQAPTMNAGDVRTLLGRDYDELLQFAKDMYESESGEERRALFRQLKPALLSHAGAEEREMYDVLLRIDESDDARDLANEGYVEHGVLDDLLEKLSRSRKTESDEWKAHAKVLLHILERHVEDSREMLFDELNERFSEDEREVMGRRFTADKARMAMKAKPAEVASVLSGQFDDFAAARAVVDELLTLGMADADLEIFALNAPGQHDRFPISG